MSSRYSINFKENLERVYFLQRIKTLRQKLEEEKQCKKEYYQKHHCENSKNGHQFQKFSPHPGCVKMVCRSCGEESPDKLFVPSVYSFKGRTFQFKKKDFRRAPSDYRCA